MANHKQAEKRNRQRLKRRSRNLVHLSTMRTFMKRVRKALETGDRATAEKRNRQRPRRQLRNRLALGSMRTALKRARAALDGKAADASALVKQAVQQIDKAVTKGVVHRRTASRLISRLTRRGNTAA